MDSAWRLLLTNAAVAALLALVALAVSRLVRRPAAAHALWLLALVKLVTPPLMPLPLLPGFDRLPTLTVPKAPTVVRMPAPEAATARFTATLPIPPAGAGHAPVEPAPSPGRFVAAALAAGAIAVLSLAAFRFARFRRLLAWAEPAPPALAARAAGIAAQLGLRRVPRLLVIPARIPPMLWPEPGGPRLLLPRELLRQLTRSECDALLAHELAHVHRRDHWVRVLELVATALFWWYPLTFWARAGLRRAEERCCDEWVLRVLPHSAEAYAQGLLKSLTFVAAAPASVPALASGASPLSELESRLKEILMSRPAPRLAPSLRLALLAVAALSLAVFPTHARQHEPRAATPVTAPAPATAPVLAPATPRPVQAPAAASAPSPAARPKPARGGEVDAQRALEEQRLALEEKRRGLREQELELQRQEIELQARAQQAELRAAVDRLRAEGHTRQAELYEKQLALVGRRTDLQRRQLALEAERLALEAKHRAEQQARQNSLSSIEQAGSADARRAVELAIERAETDRGRIERELASKHRAIEVDAEAMQEEMQRLATEEQIHAVSEATEEMARSLADQAETLKAALRETGTRPDVEREIERLEAALAALRAQPGTPSPLHQKPPQP